MSTNNSHAADATIATLPPQPDDATTVHCSCGSPDDMDMVQCDQCEKWFHFVCANVTEDIENHDWKCKACSSTNQDSGNVGEQNTFSPTKSPTARSSTSTQKAKRTAALQLQMLEEERLLRERRGEEATARQVIRDKEFLAKRFQLLMEIDMVREWLQQGSTSVNRVEKQPSNMAKFAPVSNASQPKYKNDSLPTKVRYQPDKINYKHPSSHISPPHNAEVKVQGPSVLPTSTPLPAPMEYGYPVLTTQQLAARQSLPKELPIFSGRPEEWPLFFSNFERSTEVCGFTQDENLIRLEKCLRGKALEAVRSRLLLPSNVPGIIRTLRMMFGRPEIIIEALLNKVRNEPPPRPDKLETIISYALAVENMCSTMEASRLVSHLSNPNLLQELSDKLPAQIKLNWAIYKKSISDVNISIFSSWLFQLAETISDVTCLSTYKSEYKNEKRCKRENANVHMHTEAEDKYAVDNRRSKQCCICGQSCFTVDKCRVFIDMSLNEKWEAVKHNNICRKCLRFHGRFRCNSEKLCNINECLFKHHPLLHNNKSNANTGRPHSCNIHRALCQQILFRVAPVTLYGNNKQINTFAFLDDGSSLSLVDEALADELGLDGIIKPLCLKWTANTHRLENESNMISVRISGVHRQDKTFNIRNARTVKSLDLPVQSFQVDDMTAQFKHLKGLPLSSYQRAVPRILIGLDNWKLGLPLKFREGNGDEPIATKTRLGWLAYGRCHSTQSNASFIHQSHNYHICECDKDQDDQMQKMMKDYFSLDSLGVTKAENCFRPREEQRAYDILASETVKISNHYVTSLLWKFDDVRLPNSLPMAMRRFNCLQKRLAREPELAANLRQQIADYLAKGYIRKLTDIELEQKQPRIWYLPIFPVVNPNKPSKIRIVWDAAAKVNGISLNSMLLKGPDQLSSLLGVLYRFRQRKVAICADIREMYHQVHISTKDQHVQRFLWSQDPASNTPDVYIMCVMTFGASCSPACAQYTKNINADEYADTFPRAVKAIKDNHYVDDLLDSVDTVEQATRLALEVKSIHEQGGFEIRNWISNSEEVIGEGCQKKQKDLNISADLATDKVLGLCWSTSSDCFVFAPSRSTTKHRAIFEKRPTKREVLRTLMSIFDPMGLLANFLVYLKSLLQEIWRTQLDWDQPIPGVHFEKWQKWVSLPQNSNQIKIPRCYLRKIKLGEEDDMHLHVFVDASEDAFAAVAYLRARQGAHIECALIGAKTRVAPLKMASIPRLELEYALLGARFANSIVKSHTIRFTRRSFWSDSRTVLSWLQSDHRKYRQFVAFRVSEILDLSDAHEWHYVPSKLNVADEATKWQKVPKFDFCNRWFSGPPFLSLPEEQWPGKVEICTTTEEIRAHTFHHIECPTGLIKTDRFSNWRRLLHTQMYVFRFLFNIRAKRKGVETKVGPFCQVEYRQAENHLYKQAQFEVYIEEISILQKKQNVSTTVKRCLPKSSPIYTHSPYLDNQSVLRCRDRIDAATGVSKDVKRPILLPKDHPITRLVIRAYHRKYHHRNQETVINELRQKYSIPKIRVAVKMEQRNCQVCKNRDAKARPPLMGNLPTARLSSFSRAFSHSGIDYFGPMIVTVGRHSEKRWGVLITCLTTRAIHIEIAHSLSTDSCILAIKRFIARRGVPAVIYSDNGTNFHGADRELRSVMLQQEHDLAKEFNSSATKWVFNPPSAPHMGGCWERLVRSVKTTLREIQLTRNPTDELLLSMLLEVERTINSRPLTYVAIDDENDEVLTPNHFLLGSSNGEKLDSVLCDDSSILKKNWLKSQQYANLFWKRWLREYLPTLTRRTKWYQPTKPIEEGDIVIVVDDANPRNCWPKGRILSVQQSADGQVRKATVQTSTGIYRRPATKLAVLDVRKGGGNQIIPSTPIRLPGGSVSNAGIKNCQLKGEREKRERAIEKRQ